MCQPAIFVEYLAGARYWSIQLNHGKYSWFLKIWSISQKKKKSPRPFIVLKNRVYKKLLFVIFIILLPVMLDYIKARAVRGEKAKALLRLIIENWRSKKVT